MRRTGLLICACLVFSLMRLDAGGHLVMIGGGKRPDIVMDRIIALAGGKQASIVIIPAASEDPLDSSLYARHQFETRGAQNVKFLILEKGRVDLAENLEAVRGAAAVFFTGGDQNRLTEFLKDTALLEAVRDVHRRGGVISGTSAGAAVMSAVMITGDENPAVPEGAESFTSIKSGRIVTAPGFGFMTQAIVDQHFIRRKRHNRLLSLVLENPSLIGIGIDEETAAVIGPDGLLEVLGDSLVVIYDARNARHIATDEHGNLSALNISVHLLKNGMVFNLEEMRTRK